MTTTPLMTLEESIKQPADVPPPGSRIAGSMGLFENPHRIGLYSPPRFPGQYHFGRSHQNQPSLKTPSSSSPRSCSG